MSGDGGPTPEGQRLIEAWLHAGERVRQAQSERNSAECNLANAQNALVRWMLPDDAKTGEQIAVWHGDSLIQVTVPERNGSTWNDAKVTVRKRGRSLRVA